MTINNVQIFFQKYEKLGNRYNSLICVFFTKGNAVDDKSTSGGRIKEILYEKWFYFFMSENYFLR